MAAMKNFDRRLARLEDRLAPTDFARNPRQRLRVVVCTLGADAELGNFHLPADAQWGRSSNRNRPARWCRRWPDR
jgi:hypothetical protein